MSPDHNSRNLFRRKEKTTLRELNTMSVLVTGAGSGIGEATARRLAARGARVTICGRREDKVRAVAADIGELCTARDLVQRNQQLAVGVGQKCIATLLHRFRCQIAQTLELIQLADEGVDLW